MSTGTRSPTSRAQLERSASRSTRTRSARSSRATGRAGEPLFGDRLALRLEPQRRQVRRHDGRRRALEVCRLNDELGLGLPLQLISFLEEEGSGFGQMLLGSRIVAQRVTEEELRETFRAVDDGRSFWEHAEAGGLRAGPLAGVQRTSSTA